MAINGQSLNTQDIEEVLTLSNGTPYYHDGENFFKVVSRSDETEETLHFLETRNAEHYNCARSGKAVWTGRKFVRRFGEQSSIDR